MKKSLPITVLAVVALVASCLGTNEKEGNGIEDDLTMLQVSLNRKQVNVKAHSSEKRIKSKEIVQDDGCVEKMVEIGSGGCYDDYQTPVSLGWSPKTCGTRKPGFAWCTPTGDVTSVAVCEEECLGDPDCGGFMHYYNVCWMFGKMLKPTTKYNDPTWWYKCHVKDKCCPGKYCPPFKSCSAWGDPHYTSTFYGGSHLFDFMGLGLYRMAANKDGNFELQAFQCPYKKGLSIFVAFAMKFGGSLISIIGNNVTVDGRKWTTSSGTHPTGFKVETLYAPDDRVALESPDYCVHGMITTFAHPPAPNFGYFQNLQLNLAEECYSTTGICGASGQETPVPASQSLFSADENTHLCKMCGLTDCETMAPPSDWVPISGPEEACEQAGISMTQAKEKCSGVTGDYLTACIFDYCGSDGSEDMVTNAVESEETEEAQDAELLPLEAQNPASPLSLKTCDAPYSECVAWGDPHWTNSFFWRKFDFHGLGAFTFAKSTNGDFELQAFQCPYGDTWGKVIAGFAMKVGGSRITIVDKDITINGRKFLGDEHPSGLKVMTTHTDRDTVKLHTTGSCVHLKLQTMDTYGPSPGYFHDMFLELASSEVAYEGICGKQYPYTRLTTDETLFGASELQTMCSRCQSYYMPDCSFMSTSAQDWSAWFTAIQETGSVTKSNATNGTETLIQLEDKARKSNSTWGYSKACEQTGASVDVAMAECTKIMPTEAIVDDIQSQVLDSKSDLLKKVKKYLYEEGNQAYFLNDCIFDYCVSGGKKDLLENAQESEREEIVMYLTGGI